MSDSAEAVFLSYASQDAEAAKRICESLRAVGVEVWFDADGGLEHGDEWDAKIRRQIKECVLFIPVISANTQARHEGYFRIEWDLAAERARGIASGVPFILPIVIDDTREPDALAPDRFRAVQWTKIPGGTVPTDVQVRLQKLWSHRTGVLKHEATRSGNTSPSFASRPGFQTGRGLAAVVFTDVVGYSSRMQRDETGTMALVAADFARMSEHCAEHGGEVLNTMGDGLLMCFSSAVQAVTCALQIQSEFGKRHATLPPEQALEHRMGVHIGDVFRQETGGVAGDGVNIAARLEGKAPAGGVCISQMVYDTVKGKVPMQAIFIGPESFKNITEPIPIWHVAAEGGPTPTRPPFGAGAKRKRSALVPVLATVTVVLVAGGAWFATRKAVAPAPPPPAPVAAAVGASEPKADWPALPKAGTRYGRVLLAGFENRSADPALQNFAVLLGDKLAGAFPTLDWVEAVVPPPDAVAKPVRSLADARAVGIANQADTVVSGAYYREGAKLTFQATLFDLRVGREFARLAPISGDAADPSAAIEELVQRVLGAASFIDDERRPDHVADFRKMYDFGVPPRFDARQISSKAGSMPKVTEQQQQMRRAYDLDPRGSFLSLLSLANSHFEEKQYEAAAEVVAEIKRSPERLTPYTRAYLDWIQAALVGSLADRLTAATKAHRISPRLRLWQIRVAAPLFSLNRPKALLKQLDAFEAVDKSAASSAALCALRIRAHGQLGNYEEALKLVERFREQFPDDLLSTFFQVFLLGRLGQVEASVAVWAVGERVANVGTTATRWGAFLRNGSLNFLRGHVPDAELKKLAEEVLRWCDARPERDRSAATFSPLRRARVTALKVLGRYDEVKTELERTPPAARRQPFDDWDLWWQEWGRNAVQRGDLPEARATLRWLNEQEPKYQFGKWHYVRAQIHAALGERAEALRALREAIAQSYPVVGEAMPAEFDALRDDPEYKALTELKD
jgi:class 3 adenylate cyclase/tetratricopeptide (TPR) repeat protein